MAVDFEHPETRLRPDIIGSSTEEHEAAVFKLLLSFHFYCGSGSYELIY